ncbi:MAG: PD-(D/E)XK nuclease family protein [Verrucomicrobiia bacterium]
MNPRLITAPTFPQLECRLLTDLAAACLEDPFAPKWIVVPNATLANHLRARLALADGEGALVGVRVANLPTFAGRLAVGMLRKDAVRWGVIHDLVLEELVAGLPKSSPLAPLRGITGGAGLLHDTFVDLAHGGFGIEDPDKVRELAKVPEFEERERAVLRLFADFVERLRERKISWGPMILQELQAKIEAATGEEIVKTLGAQEGQRPQVFVHGFYEWLDVNLGWLAAMVEKVPTRIYYPWLKVGRSPHPAYAFGEEILEELGRRFTFLEFEEIGDEPGACARFFIGSFPEGRVEDPPPFLTWQRAAGPRAEAISAAVRVRSWLDEGIPPEEILVTASVAEGYGDALRGVFREFAIPLRVSDLPAGATPADDVLRALARIWGEKAPAERVFALLRSGPLPPVAKGVDVDAFERKVRELGIWGGATWRAFADLTGDGAPTPAERRLVEGILVFGEDRPAASDELSIKQALAIFEDMAKNWLADPSPMGALLDDVREAAQGAKGLRLEMREWVALLAGEASGQTLRDPPSRSVQFAPVMRARGLTAKAVVFLGLASGEMPRRVDDNPLLSDAACRRIALAAKGIGHRLPLKSRVPEEMLLLFQLVNTSAERVHWVVPETDAAGRAVAPTPWVQRYLQRWKVGREALFKERIPPSTRLQAEWLAGLDPEHGSWLPPSFALYLDAKLAASAREGVGEERLSASMDRRGREPDWSGAIHERFSGNRLGVKRIGWLAECPFRFRCEEIEKLVALDSLSPAYELDRMARGTWLHLVLEAAIRPHLKQRKLSEIAEEALANDGAALAKLARVAAVSDKRLKFALDLIPQVFRESEALAIAGVAARYFRWAKEQGGVPQEVEVKVDGEWPQWPGLCVVGKIDQVEKEAGGELVVDFKSGKHPGWRPYATAARLGWNVQATLYPWLHGGEAVEFRYLYLGDEKAQVGESAGAPAAEGLLAELAPFLEKGFYPPTSLQTVAALGRLPEKDVPGCSFCEMASVCRRFEMGHAARHAKLLEEHAPRRSATIRGMGQEPAKGRKR